MSEKRERAGKWVGGLVRAGKLVGGLVGYMINECFVILCFYRLFFFSWFCLPTQNLHLPTSSIKTKPHSPIYLLPTPIRQTVMIPYRFPSPPSTLTSNSKSKLTIPLSRWVYKMSEFTIKHAMPTVMKKLQWVSSVIKLVLNIPKQNFP